MSLVVIPKFDFIAMLVLSSAMSLDELIASRFVPPMIVALCKVHFIVAYRLHKFTSASF